MTAPKSVDPVGFLREQLGSASPELGLADAEAPSGHALVGGPSARAGTGVADWRHSCVQDGRWI
jgi:hypothetical protein